MVGAGAQRSLIPVSMCKMAQGRPSPGLKVRAAGSGDTQSRCLIPRQKFLPLARCPGIFVGEGIVKEHLARALWALVLGGAGEAYGLGLGTMALAGTG